MQLPVDSSWERGLIGVTVAPDFPKTPHVFVCYVAAKPYPHHVVSRFTAKGNVAEAGSEKILLRGDDQSKLGGSVPAGHQGGAIHFGKDGKLYVAIGDQTAGKPAQEMNSLLGRLLRINANGSIPDDNPFFTKAPVGIGPPGRWACATRSRLPCSTKPAGCSSTTWAVTPRKSTKAKPGRITVGRPSNMGRPATRVFAGRSITIRLPASLGRLSPGNLRWPKEYRGRYFFGDFNHGWIKSIDPARPAVARSFAIGLRRPVDLRFAADGSLYVLVRDAWVIDKWFKGGTGALIRIRYRGK